MNTALYIGCGRDFEPVKDLLTVRNFIFIDSSPFSNNGDMYKKLKNDNNYYSKSYMSEFMEKANQAGFYKISIDGVYPHVYKNYNTHQQVYHYFSLIFPFISIKMNNYADKDEMAHLIYLLNDVNYLIVRRYQPHYSIFKYILKPVVLVTYSDTIWTEKTEDLLDYEKDKIHIFLQNGYLLSKIFKFNLINNEVIEEYKSYDDFINKFIT